MSGLVPIAAVCALVAFAAYAIVLSTNQVTQYFRAVRFHEAERELLRARIEQLAAPISKIQSHASEFAWSGFRKFVLKGKVLEAEDICSFYLAPHDAQPLPPYLPGQYLTFQLNIPGQPRPVTRCYSLSDSPHHPDYYRITVKRIASKRGELEGKHGLVSTFLQHGVQADDLIDVKAPGGHFYLDVDQRAPVVLIAGGIGITPLLSMLNYLIATGSTREVWFFYGVQDGSQHIMKDYLRQVATEHENVHMHVCYSQPHPEDRADEDYHHGERVSIDLLKRLLPSSNYNYYICGPAAMMNQLTSDLRDWGVPKTHIHFEAFGPATVKSVSKEIPEAARGSELEVTFSRSGKTVIWDGSASSLLEMAEAHGIAMESGCRAGNCGTCLTAVRGGQVEYLSEPGAPIEEGSCLTCISIPKSKLNLDA